MVVAVNPAVTLAAGKYTAEIVLQASAGSPSMVIPVTLTINPATATFFDDMPGAVTFFQATGGANPGAAVFAGVEGARPLLVEIQALVAPTTLGTPRRAVVGWEPSRLAMVLAVLEAHGGMKLGQYDVYLNVAGGLRIMEPAADLAAAAALISSLTGASLPRDGVYFGEIALSGSVRAVAHPGLRLKEAAKLGFANAFAPPSPRADGETANIATQPIGTVATLVALIASSAVEARAARAGTPTRSGVTN